MDGYSPCTTHSLLSVIGNTPLVELTRSSPKEGVRIFAKLEGNNPTGSIKDRVARALMQDAANSGRLKPGGTVVEASSGNTGIAVAMVARQMGFEAQIVLPQGIVPSICDALNILGVPIHRCQSHAGMKGAIDVADELAERLGGVCLQQFRSPTNVSVHYQTTGAEIACSLERVDAFVAGIGTGGTITGVGRRLRETNPDVRIVGVEPQMGERLQGLKRVEDGFAPPLLDFDLLSRRLMVDAATSIRTAKRLAEVEGIVAGMSAGATFHAALREAERMDQGNIVVMFSDGGWKYLPVRPWDAAVAGDAELDEIHWW
jgi:cysteine synthase B